MRTDSATISAHGCWRTVSVGGMKYVLSTANWAGPKNFRLLSGNWLVAVGRFKALVQALTDSL